MATRFKFRLEALLKLRHSLEEEAQRNLARTLTHQEHAQAAFTELRHTHEATIEGQRTTLNQVIDVELWQATGRFLLVLERRLLVAAQEIVAAQARVAEARKALLKAHQDHLMLLRLKERRLELHNLEVSRIEAREMDEIAVLRHRLKPDSST